MKTRALLGSLALHAILAVALFRGGLTETHFSDRTLERPIEIQTIAIEKPRRQLVRTARVGAHANGPEKVLGLADLGLTFDFSAAALGVGAVGRASAPKAAVPASGGAAAVFAGESKNNGLYRLLYQRIGENVGYPAELRQAMISGAVTADLSFSATADYQSGQSTLSGGSAYLRVLVAQALRRALREPLPETMRHPDGPFIVHCLFVFAITEHDEEDLKAEGNSQLGADFHYFRNWQHSKLSWDLGPFHGLFPVPALAFSPGELVDAIGSLFSKKSVPDPLQRYRDDPVWGAN